MMQRITPDYFYNQQNTATFSLSWNVDHDEN